MEDKILTSKLANSRLIFNRLKTLFIYLFIYK